MGDFFFLSDGRAFEVFKARLRKHTCYFMWMATHAGLHVGSWATRVGHDPTCSSCQMHVVETISHTFMDMLSIASGMEG